MKTLSRRREYDSAATSTGFANQWQHPREAFSVLLLLGGDVVQKALAQSTGGRLPVPSFSFGMSPLRPRVT
jgi:hypothetical protein